MLDISILLDISFTTIFSRLVNYLFILWKVSFGEQKVFILMRNNSFISCALVLYIGNHCLTKVTQILSYILQVVQFYVSYLDLWSIFKFLNWKIIAIQCCVDFCNMNIDGEDVEKREPPHTFGGNVKWCSHYREQYEGFLKD